jgi:hypothetical protein
MTELDPRAGATAPHSGPTGSVLSAATVDDAVLALRPTTAPCSWWSPGAAGRPTPAHRRCRERSAAPSRDWPGAPEALAEWPRGGRPSPASASSPGRAQQRRALLRHVEAGLPRVDRLTDLTTP